MQPFAATDPDATRVRLTERPPDPKLFGIANRVARALGVNGALITFVDDANQTVVAHSELPADVARANATTWAWSFSRHIVQNARRLVVNDTRDDVRFSSSFLVATNRVRAYAGVPIFVEGAGAAGAVCVIHDQARAFDESDMTLLEMAAQVVAAQIEAEQARSASRVPLSAIRKPGGAMPAVGALLDGKYWITASLGQGGQATVLLGRDRLTGQLVAIKVMQAAPDAEETLLREARALASVRHPNLVTLHGWGHTEGGRLYVVLDYVEGATLDGMKRALPADEETAFLLKTTRELAGALATIHGAGLIHGDVKPSNVILDRQLDRAVLIDLGIGVLFEQKGTQPTGATLGFSAPEQFCGESLTPAADVYGLASTLYTVLAGRGPFQGHPVAHILGAQLGARFSPLSDLRPDLPVAASTILSRALSPAPLERPATVLELAHSLERAFVQHGARRRSLEFAKIARASGRVFRLWREEMLVELGARHEGALVSQIPAAAREVIVSPKNDDGWYAADAFLAYVEAMGEGDVNRLEALGEQTIARMLPDLLSLLNVTRTMSTLVRVVPDMARKVGDWLEIDVQPTDDGALRLVMNMPPRFAPTMCAVHRGTARGIGVFMGVDIEITEPHCRSRGDATCDLLVRWSVPGSFA
jgi:hypothetical protein